MSVPQGATRRDRGRTARPKRGSFQWCCLDSDEGRLARHTEKVVECAASRRRFGAGSFLSSFPTGAAFGQLFWGLFSWPPGPPAEARAASGRHWTLGSYIAFRSALASVAVWFPDRNQRLTSVYLQPLTAALGCGRFFER